MQFAANTAVAFLSLIIGYGGYVFAVVPVFAPPAVDGQSQVTQWEITDPNSLMPEEKYLQLLEHYFPAEHWIRDQKSKFAGVGPFLLAASDYQAFPDGRLNLKSCVVFYFRTPWEPGEAIPRDAIVIEAQHGAELQWDREFRLTQDGVGKLLSARVVGDVLMTSGMSDPSHEDDLWVSTKNIQWNEKRIWTDADVDFRLGPHEGHGKTLEIRFIAAEGAAPNKHMPNIEGIQSLQLLSDVRFKIVPSQELETSARQREDSTPPEKPVAADPLFITSDGPLNFDLVQKTLDLDRNVRAHRTVPLVGVEELLCDRLRLFFEEIETPSSTSTDSQEKMPWTPIALEAFGRPVEMRRGAETAAKCSWLRYETSPRRLVMSADVIESPVTAEHDGMQLAAPSLEYRFGKGKQLGTFFAPGPGMVQVSPKTAGGNAFEARWKNQAQLVRQEGQPVLSLFGRPSLAVPTQGRLHADGIHLWLREEAEPLSSPDSNREAARSSASPRTDRLSITNDAFSKISPDRMLAQGNVEIHWGKSTGHLDRVEAWFQTGSFSATATPENATSSASPANPNKIAQDKEEATYQIAGEVLQLECTLPRRIPGEKAPQPTLDEITLSGAVSITGSSPGDGGATSIRGDWLQVQRLQRPDMSVALSGEPARLQARGVVVTGTGIHVDQAQQRIWIDSPGTAETTLDQALDGRPLSGRTPVRVTWQDRLEFDGRQLVLSGGVNVWSPSQSLDTLTMIATLDRPLDWQHWRNAPPEFTTIECLEGVVLNRRSEPAALEPFVEYAQAKSLLIDRRRGELNGEGPGFVRTVRLGSASPTQRERDDSPGLYFLRVDYTQGFRGWETHQEIEFFGGVQTIYGPVQDWSDRIEIEGGAALPEEVILIQSQTLAAHRRSLPHLPRPWCEIRAQGNVQIEGEFGEQGTFTATAERLTYDQRKDLVILDGGSRNATLDRETTPGGNRQHTEMQRIQYLRSKNHIFLKNVAGGSANF